jgi:hypothetical protein
MVQTPIVEARLSLANADSHFRPSQLLGLVVKLCLLRGVPAVSGGHVTSYGGVTPRVVEVLVFSEVYQRHKLLAHSEKKVISLQFF